MKKNIKTAEGKLTPDDIATGSTIAAIMNMNPYQDAVDILKRAFDATEGIPRPELDFEALHWGTAFEVPILHEACNRLGLGDPKTTFKKAFFSEHYPMAVSLDGMVAGRGKTLQTDYEKGIIVYGHEGIKLTGQGVIEAKLTSQELEQDLPYYRGRLQLQMAMDIVDAQWGAVAVLHKGIKLMIHVFPRDVDTMAMIRDAAVDFDRRVQKYVTNQETEWYEFKSPKSAAKIYDRATDDEIDLSDITQDIQYIVENQDQIHALQEETDHLQARVMARMGDYKHARAGHYKIVWGERTYKPTPEKVIPAKPGNTIRLSKIKIKEI